VADWQLGIDFGTSRVRAAVADDAGTSLIELEPEGGTWMPAGVFQAEDGEILVGNAACWLAALLPERFEPEPRRLLGQAELFLASALVEVTGLAAAVLRRAFSAASRLHGTAPRRVLLTYPGQWADPRQSALLEAAEQAGIPDPELVTEAEAAAQPSFSATEPGQHIAVCDFGGARSEVTVLRRTDTGFAVAGPPAERDPFGGDDIDELIIAHLGESLGEEHPDEWRALRKPSDARGRRRTGVLRDEVRRAREALNDSEACELSIPGISPEIQLTRAELRLLTAEVGEAAVDLLELTVDRAGVVATDLASVYLVGGSGGMPQLQDAIWRRLGVRPLLSPDPGGAVAKGAGAYRGPPRRLPTRSPAGVSRPRRSGASPAGPRSMADDGGVAFAPSLALALTTSDWSGATECSAHLSLAPGPGSAVALQLRDEPAPLADTAQLAVQLKRDLSLRPDLEELWSGPVPVAGEEDGWELLYAERAHPGAVALRGRCLLGDGRALIVTAPEGLRPVLDSVARRRHRLGGGKFDLGWTASHPPGWTTSEQVVLRRAGTAHSVKVTCSSAGRPLTPEAWAEEQLAAFVKLPGVEPARHTPGRVCGRLDGDIVTIRWRDGGRQMRTKVGLAVSGHHGYAVEITLPRDEQELFPSLALHAQLHPGAARVRPGPREESPRDAGS
jgi:hypothetical protein